MNATVLKTIQRIIAAGACLAVAALGQDITPTEQSRALQYLEATQDGVVQALQGLSAAQMRFKPAPDRWSVAETLEHIAVTEEFFVQGIRPKLESSPAAEPQSDRSETDAAILAKVPDRSKKFQAPPPLEPKGRWMPAEALQHFLSSRQHTTQYLTSHSDLRQHSVNHPALGPLDGYEWVLAIAAHSERHTKQILEIKAAPKFPSR